MKKLVLTATATLATMAALAQGKIGFSNDSNHLVYYDSTTGSLSGTAAYAGNVPSGVTLMADIYMGTSSSSLFLYSSTTFSAVSPGKWNALSVQATANGTTGAPAIGGGTSAFVEFVVRDTGGTAKNTLSASDLQDKLAYAGAQGFSYIGFSQEFTLTLGSSVTYPPASTSGTWAIGTQDMSVVGPGQKGAIGISAVPEPASFALAGLGAAGLMIFRRRKS